MTGLTRREKLRRTIERVRNGDKEVVFLCARCERGLNAPATIKAGIGPVCERIWREQGKWP